MDDHWQQALYSTGAVEILKRSKVKLSSSLDRANAAPDALCRQRSVGQLTVIMSSMPNLKQTCVVFFNEPLKERKKKYHIPEVRSTGEKAGKM